MRFREKMCIWLSEYMKLALELAQVVVGFLCLFVGWLVSCGLKLGIGGGGVSM